MTPLPVPQPLFISARLMAALKLDDESVIHLEVTGRDDEGRVTTRCVIESAEGNELYDGVGVSSGCRSDADYLELMESTLGFLSHTADQYRYKMGEEPEDGWSFNAAVAEWAYQNDDAISCALMDLEDEDDG